MKIRPFEDTVVSAPEKTSDGTWGFSEFPPIGGDVWHGDFSTREKARVARRKVLLAAKASGAVAEYVFRKNS